MLDLNRIYNMDCRKGMQQLDDECVDIIVTSPPYWNLRDYGTKSVDWGDWNGELGQEPTPELFVEHLADVFDEAMRVVKRTGSIWVNLGDSYLDRDLTFVPAMFALEMKKRGWVLRNVVIWHKPNGIPESVSNRFTNDFEYMFLFTKIRSGYFFEQQFEPHTSIGKTGWERSGRGTKKYDDREDNGKSLPSWSSDVEFNPLGRNKRAIWSINTRASNIAHFATFPPELVETPIKAGCPLYICKKCNTPRNRKYEVVVDEANIPKEGWKKTYTGKQENENTPYNRSVSEMYKESLSKQRIFKEYSDCGCGGGFDAGVVMDPFAGIATTLITAYKLHRNFIGFELSKEFYDIAVQRLRKNMSNTKITQFFG